MDPRLLARVLERLGVAAPEPTLEGLSRVYGAWCERVPFDNLQKRRHLHRVSQGELAADLPLPGSTAEAFFEDWLRDGSGGTCWAGNGALCDLLLALGFDAERGLATMLAAPDLPPNHGTVRVKLAGGHYLCDASMLSQQPLPLVDGGETRVEHPAWGVRCAPSDDGRAIVHWRAGHREELLGCRLERYGLDAAEFDQYHERTRAWGPFNFAISFRINRDDRVHALGLGERVTIDDSGRSSTGALTPEQRTDYLVGLGIRRALAESLPPDEPMPPPPT